MPTLHLQFNPLNLTTPTGQVQLPPAMALAARGPVLQVNILLHHAASAALVQLGQVAPTPISGQALIDTGASGTCIDNDAAQKMGLPIIDIAQVASASHAATFVNVYPVSLEIVGLPNALDVPRAIGAELAAQGLIALIGRDALGNGVLVYNGMAGAVTLCI